MIENYTFAGIWPALYVAAGWYVLKPPSDDKYALAIKPANSPSLVFTVGIIAYILWQQPEISGSPSIAAVCGTIGVIGAVLGAWALRTNTAWIEHPSYPAYLRPIAYDGIDLSMKRFLNRECFFVGYALGAAQMLQFQPRLYWSTILLGVPWLLIMFAQQVIELRRAFRRIRYVPPAPDWSSDHWDAFLSYRSLNSNIVRNLAERMIAKGVRPWFAELMILFTGRDQFQTLIDTGIDRSTTGILFTNDEYASSTHCEKELRRLLPDDSNGKPVMELRIPDEPLMREKHASRLRDAASVEYTTCDQAMDEIEKFLTKHEVEISRSHPIGASAKQKNESVTFESQAGCLTLNTGDLKPGHAADNCPPSVILRSPQLTGTWQSNPVKLNLLLANSEAFDLQSAQKRYRPNDKKSLESKLQQLLVHPDMPAGSSDRWLLSAARDQMMLHCASIGAECRGIHLHWQWERPHLLLTYWHRDRWVRRYFLRMPEHNLTIDARFQIVGHFQDYCRHGSRMDEIIQSCHWAPSSSKVIHQSLIETSRFSEEEFIQDMMIGDPRYLHSKAFHIADTALSAEDLKYAQALLKRATEILPTRPEIWNEYAFVSAKLGEWEISLEASRLAHVLHPSYPKYAVNHIGRTIDALLEDPDESKIDRELPRLRQEIAHLQEQFPDYPSVYAWRASFEALEHGEWRSAWEESLVQYARAYKNRTSMQSGKAVTQQGLATAMLNAVNSCLTHSALSSRSEAIRSATSS